MYRVVPEPLGELETSTSILELPLQTHHFNKQGRLKIKCTASLHSLYWQTTEKSAEEEKPRNHFMHNDVIDSNDIRHSVDEDEVDDDIYLRGTFFPSFGNYLLIEIISCMVTYNSFCICSNCIYFIDEN